MPAPILIGGSGNNPSSTSVKTSSYTIPAGKYAEIVCSGTRLPSLTNVYTGTGTNTNSYSGSSPLIDGSSIFDLGAYSLEVNRSSSGGGTDIYNNLIFQNSIRLAGSVTLNVSKSTAAFTVTGSVYAIVGGVDTLIGTLSYGGGQSGGSATYAVNYLNCTGIKVLFQTNSGSVEAKRVWADFTDNSLITSGYPVTYKTFVPSGTVLTIPAGYKVSVTEYNT